MNIAVFRALIYADSRMLWRDPLLGWILALPIGLALLLRALIPRVQEALLAGIGFDFAPYHALVMSGYLMTAPGMVGMVIGFLFLDERDARTLTALRTTPLSMRLVPRVPRRSSAAARNRVDVDWLPADRLDPAPADIAVGRRRCCELFSATPGARSRGGCADKVAGFAVVKVLNAVNLLPIVAYFVPRPVQYAAGVLPAYWPMRAFWSAGVGESFAGYLVCGTVVSVLALLLTAWLFDRRLLRHG